MSNYGFKISKEGKDVFTVENKDQIFTSFGFGLKIYKEGRVDVTIPGGSADFSEHYVDIPHDLGYAPSYYAFVENKDGDMIGLNIAFIEDMKENTADIGAKAWSDSTKLRLILTVVDDLATDITRTFKYYIFAEPIE